MPVALPPKVLQTLAPAIGGDIGAARELRFNKLINVFAGHFGCQVERRKNGVFKITPPEEGKGIWEWPRTSVFIWQPANGLLTEQDLYAVSKDLKNAYDWDKETFV